MAYTRNTMPAEHEQLMQQHLREENLSEAVMPAVPVVKVLKGQKALVTGANSGIVSRLPSPALARTWSSTASRVPKLPRKPSRRPRNGARRSSPPSVGSDASWRPSFCTKRCSSNALTLRNRLHFQQNPHGTVGRYGSGVAELIASVLLHAAVPRGWASCWRSA